MSGARLRRLLVDPTPLRVSRAYRRLWFGSMVSGLGTQMTIFAVALQVYRLTGSAAAVGGVGLAAAGPGVVVGLLGGSVVDAVDRRRLVLLTSTGLLAISVALAAQAFVGAASVWLLYALVAVQSSLGALNAPARQTFMPRLLPPELMSSGAALQMLAMHTSVVAGPAAAGALTASAGLRFCYLVDAVSFLAALYGVARLPPMRPDGGGRAPGLRSTLEGLRFVRDHGVLAGAFLSDLAATVFAMPIALFPSVADDRFGGSPRMLGLMTTALGVGGLVGALASGPVRRVSRPGLGMLVAGTVWALALAGFGAVGGAAATLGLLVLAGTADVVSVVLRTALVQLATPDDVRGRVNATNYVVGGLGPQVGNVRAGAVASLTSAGTSAVVGGLVSAAALGALAVGVPALRRYRTDAVSVPR